MVIRDPKAQDTIAQHWKVFSQMVLPEDAGDVQREEMRRAFYAGYATAFAQVNSLTEENENVAYSTLSALNAEIQTYLRSMIAVEA